MHDRQMHVIISPEIYLNKIEMGFIPLSISRATKYQIMSLQGRYNQAKGN